MLSQLSIVISDFTNFSAVTITSPYLPPNVLIIDLRV